MPQLDPTPWFPILLLSWFMLLTIVTNKTLNYTVTNNIGPLNPHNLETKTWEWTW
uniref:ATP synthase F0 subunit 8 n=1 Tax=Megalechis thoracata TaxID=245781 RepID=UPI0030E38492